MSKPQKTVIQDTDSAKRQSIFDQKALAYMKALIAEGYIDKEPQVDGKEVEVTYRLSKKYHNEFPSIKGDANK